MARAIVIKKAYARYRQLDRKEQPPRKAAFDNKGDANSPARCYILIDARSLQNHLTEYPLLIISTEHMNSAVYAGTYATKQICLLHRGDNFDFLNKIHAWFRSVNYCYKFLKPWKHRERHRRYLRCKICFHMNCENFRDLPVHCNDCGRIFLVKTVFKAMRRSPLQAEIFVSDFSYAKNATAFFHSTLAIVHTAVMKSSVPYVLDIHSG